MDHSEIIKSLKQRHFSPIYLLQGKEPFYIDLVSDYIEKKVLDDAQKSFNQTILYGRDTDIFTLLNHVKRYPMMSDYQVVIVKEAQDLKLPKDESSKNPHPWSVYLENPLKSTILVLCYKYDSIDKRSKSYKLIEKSGVVLDTKKLYDNELPNWIEKHIKELGYFAQPQVCSMIAEHLGNDLTKIANELEKLVINIQKGAVISPKEVQDNIGISKEYNIFEFQKAIGERNFSKSLQIATYMGDNSKNFPMSPTLASLSGFFTKILKYHYAKDKSSSSIASLIGVHPFFVKDYEIAARNFSYPKVCQAIEVLRTYDLKIKGVNSTSNMEDSEFLKELLLKIW